MISENHFGSYLIHKTVDVTFFLQISITYLVILIETCPLKS